MGGIIAVRAALERPERVTHLVLSVTSDGVNMPALGAQDWRPDFAAENPDLPRWFLDDQSDLTDRLAELHMPVLLLWGTVIRSALLRWVSTLSGCCPARRCMC